MKKLFCLVCAFVIALCSYSKPIKLACVGNSITVGAGIPISFQNSYPGILMQMLGEEYDVRNFAVGGTTTLMKGYYPYTLTENYKQALEFLPDIVTIKLGTNDSKSFNWVHGKEFEKDLTSIVKSFLDLSSHPKVFLCLPVPSLDYSSREINDSTIQASIIPSIRKVAKKLNVPVIDLHEALKPYPALFPDHVHPNAKGSQIIASHVYRALTGKEYEGEIDIDAPFPGSKTLIKGFDSYSFYYHGSKATIIKPKNKASGMPWLLSKSSSLSKVDELLLERGFHVVLYTGNELNSILTYFYGFSKQNALESSDTVFLKNDAFAIYYTGENDFKHSAPMISLHNCNSAIENLSNEENAEAVADFIYRYHPEYGKYQKINYRGTLHNAFLKFAKEKKGCVAFLGGSITEMQGWRNMVEENLRHRFPDCYFQFIDAGISSLGSIPHSFRMANDILEKGTPDLMFVEAAVNDDTNSPFQYVAQTRAMEGIIRHALNANQYMDIVMLHFIYDPFIPLHQSGKLPDVIMNHERVANWYGITSIDLSSEIAARMDKGEFTWQQFGGTHPAWFGHKFYAAAINKIFDRYMNENGDKIIHDIPNDMLDKFSYKDGNFLNIDKAEKLNGFSIVQSWNNPVNGASTRKQYVNIPMLASNKTGSTLELDFDGSAIGIYGTFGPNSGIIEYSIDGSPFKKLNTHTQWSGFLYIPWVYVFEDTLSQSKHRLSLKVTDGDCLIYKFVTNANTN